MSDQSPRLSRRTVMGALAGLPALQPSAGGAAEPRRGGTLNVLLNWEPPALLSFTSTSSLPLSAKVTEGLLQYDNDMVPHPQLATEWAVAPDGLTYTFKLREGVKWHDGRDFTSADVAYSIMTLKTAHPRGRSTFSQVTEATTPDAHTVVLKLARPTPYLLRALQAAESPIVPKHLYDGTDPFTNPHNSAPIGTGPFKFKEWVRGSHVIYERNDAYWDQPRPYLDRIIAKYYPDMASRSVAFETKACDIGYRTPVVLNDVARLQRLDFLGFERKGYAYSPPNILCVDFNLSNEALAKFPVRQALAHAVDRTVIARTVFYGLATPCASPIVPGLAAFHDPTPSPYGFDVRKAEALLEEAGYPRGADRIRLRLRLDYPGEENRRLADYLRAAFSRIGVSLDTRSNDFGAHVKRVYTDRDFDMQIASMSNLFDPCVGVQRCYWSKNIIRGVPFSNPSGYSNPDADALMEASMTELDNAKRVDMWKQVQRMVIRDIPTLNLVSPDWMTIHQTRVAGHSVSADGYEGTFAYAYLEA